MKNVIVWMKAKDHIPAVSQRVLTYSSVYNGKPELAFRLLDSQFIHMCTDVTYWAYLDEPKED